MATRIKLKKKERNFLKEFVRKGTKNARKIVRANILLLADRGQRTKNISQATGAHRQSIWRVKERYLKGGIGAALEERPRPGQPSIYKEKDKAEIIAMTCTTPPEGRKRWSLVLLVEELRKNKKFKRINRESVRLILKKQSQTMAEKDVVHPKDNRRIQREDVRHS
jgi:transposase